MALIVVRFFYTTT